MPTVASLYSGIGGGDLGFERAGFRVAWQAECDPWRARVLAFHWPGTPRYQFVEDVVDPLEDDPLSVDLLYAGLPSRDPEWLTPVWPVVERLRPPFLVIETGLRCREALVDGFTRLGYHGVGINLACEARRLGSVTRRARTFAVARLGTADGLGALHAVTDAADGFHVDETEGAAPTTIPEVVEALVGLPIRWTCLCGQAPGECEDTSARLLAANECLSPTLAQWLGSYLLALRPQSAVAVPVEA